MTKDKIMMQNSFLYAYRPVLLQPQKSRVIAYPQCSVNFAFSSCLGLGKETPIDKQNAADIEHNYGTRM